ncbi:MAG: DUF5063 domain-containing protein [Bacteroidales bacterium]|nr:DUF5063 domain-containing protein [Bacteroidales bacterium]
MNETFDRPEYGKNVMEILTVANDFCLTLDKIYLHKKKFLIDYFQKICPLLYIKGALLTDIEVLNPDMNERFVTEEQWELLFNELRKIFKEDDEFWYIDNSKAVDKEPIKASLSECIADIYQDMKDFVLLYQKSSLDAKQNAIAQLKKTFVDFWGFKLLLVSSRIHSMLQENESSEAELNIPELI